jgi:hypothetical protein
VTDTTKEAAIRTIFFVLFMPINLYKPEGTKVAIIIVIQADNVICSLAKNP